MTFSQEYVERLRIETVGALAKAGICTLVDGDPTGPGEISRAVAALANRKDPQVIYWLDNDEFVVCRATKIRSVQHETWALVELDLSQEPLSKYVGKEDWFGSNLEGHVYFDTSTMGYQPGEWELVTDFINRQIDLKNHLADRGREE